jgi:hypothetical protein
MPRFLALVLLLTLLPRLAWADPPAPVIAVPPGEDVIVVVKKDAPAPFTGQLFDQATALRWGNWLQQYRYRLQADVELQKKLDAADIDYQKKLVALAQEKYERVTGELEAKNTLLTTQLYDRPFYTSVWFGVVLGALAMGACVGLAAYGLSSTR